MQPKCISYLFLCLFAVLIIASCKKEREELREDGHVRQLYFNDPKGINILVLGDGFLKEDLQPNGPYDRHVKEAIDQLLSVAPLSQYKKHFNVYVVYAESNQRGIYWGTDISKTNTKFGVHFTDSSSGMLLIGNYENYYQYADKALPWNEIHMKILIANDNSLDAASASSIALITTSDNSKRALVHEFGHSFALLGDEYIFPEIAHRHPIEEVSQKANLDTSNDPSEVKWSHYLNNKNYHGVVGMFEGGYYRLNGVFRPEESSVMSDVMGPLYF